ncbi:MAG TPA: hypothetical protein VFC78_16150 [Tepidisphaeraceae bacterium]|nr:hypothetical protein [Tepidisphaeraceae bacterium]
MEPNDSRAIDRTQHPDRIWYWMRALGRDGLPDRVEVNGVTWHLARSVKHDFVAATGFYDDAAGQRVVLKIGRTASMFGLPMAWLGKWSCRREVHFYQKLADLPNIPRVLGTVGKTGFVHEYVQGRPLCKDKPVPDGFFGQLMDLLAELHRRGIAYVDTNKPENILLGDDGRPHLIDFQISWDHRPMLRHLQGSDIYHVLKHKKRLRRDELTEQELARVCRISWPIRLHRFIFKPWFYVRRRMFRHLRATGRLLPEGSK